MNVRHVIMMPEIKEEHLMAVVVMSNIMDGYPVIGTKVILLYCNTKHIVGIYMTARHMVCVDWRYVLPLHGN